MDGIKKLYMAFAYETACLDDKCVKKPCPAVLGHCSSKYHESVS